MQTCPSCAAHGRHIPLAPLAGGLVLIRCVECGETHRRPLVLARPERAARLAWSPVAGEA